MPHMTFEEIEAKIDALSAKAASLEQASKDKESKIATLEAALKKYKSAFGDPDKKHMGKRHRSGQTDEEEEDEEEEDEEKEGQEDEEEDEEKKDEEKEALKAELRYLRKQAAAPKIKFLENSYKGRVDEKTLTEYKAAWEKSTPEKLDQEIIKIRPFIAMAESQAKDEPIGFSTLEFPPVFSAAKDEYSAKVDKMSVAELAEAAAEVFA